MKKFLKSTIMYIIIGMLLGTISEFALIFNWKLIIKITQSFLFWGIIMMFVGIISKKYKYAIINSTILMITMNSTYYIIRLIKSGYTNIGNWKMYNFICIGGALFFATLIFIFKDIFTKKKNYFRVFNLIVMIILGTTFAKFYISLGFRFHNIMADATWGVMNAFILTFLLEKVYEKIKNRRN